MYKSVNHGFMKNMDKTALLKMREEGLSNLQIAKKVACSSTTIYNLIGKQPTWMTERDRKAGLERMWAKRMDGTPVPKPIEAEEPVEQEKKAVLAVKKVPHPIELVGANNDYWINGDRNLIEVRDKNQNTLMYIYRDGLATLIEELQAISGNIDSGENAMFWA